MQVGDQGANAAIAWVAGCVHIETICGVLASGIAQRQGGDLRPDLERIPRALREQRGLCRGERAVIRLERLERNRRVVSVSAGRSVLREPHRHDETKLRVNSLHDDQAHMFPFG